MSSNSLIKLSSVKLLTIEFLKTFNQIARNIYKKVVVVFILENTVHWRSETADPWDGKRDK